MGEGLINIKNIKEGNNIVTCKLFNNKMEFGIISLSIDVFIYKKPPTVKYLPYG